MMEHIIDKVCSCTYCMMLDAMWGDPSLSTWEYNFVERTSGFGWRRNYTTKEKNRIMIIFNAQRKKYSHSK